VSIIGEVRGNRMRDKLRRDEGDGVSGWGELLRPLCTHCDILLQQSERGSATKLMLSHTHLSQHYTDKITISYKTTTQQCKAYTTFDTAI
jgi:hypothetical protein